MKNLKKNKNTIIAIVAFLLIVLLLVQLKDAFFPDEEHAIYGNRLEGRRNVTISDSKKKSIITINTIVTDTILMTRIVSNEFRLKTMFSISKSGYYFSFFNK